VLKWAEEEKVPLLDALARVTSHPAQLLGVKVGYLTAGAHADLCVFDPADTWKVEPAALKSQGKNTPFNGYTMQGRARYTIVEGHVAYSS
jgi:dihydroorotase